MLAAFATASVAAAHGAVLVSGVSTERFSVATDGTEANRGSFTAAVSSDGRYVAFSSDASNLVGGDTNGAPDVFLRDRVTGAVERVSVGAPGIAGDGVSFSPALSADGRYVAFESYASDLVTGDTNRTSDVFIRDRETGVTERISVGGGGVEANALSWAAAVSGDGRYVAFQSFASNLVPGDTNNAVDVFVHDRHTRTVERVSVGSGGAEGNLLSAEPSISADGRYVAFASPASTLVGGDTNSAVDVFVRDRETGSTERITVGPAGVQSNGLSGDPAISADGRYVAFSSNASNLVAVDANSTSDVFVWNRLTGTIERVTVGELGAEGNGLSFSPAISADGRHVAFQSLASNLVPGDTNGTADVFVRDTLMGCTERVSLSVEGAQGNGGSAAPAISGDGRYVAFQSTASNLVAADTNNAVDVFVRDRSADDARSCTRSRRR